MITNDLGLKKFFQERNQEEFGQLIIDRFRSVDNAIENERWIDISNGTSDKVLVKDVVLNLYNNQNFFYWFFTLIVFSLIVTEIVSLIMM